MTSISHVARHGNQLVIVTGDGEHILAYPTPTGVWTVAGVPPPDPNPPTPGARFVWPFDPRPQAEGGTVSSEYGPRWGRVHQGIDFAGRGAAHGNPIPASGAGTVQTAGWHNNFGWHVILNHGDSLRTLYAHMDRAPSVTVGQSVAQGQTLGVVGNTGASRGSHLHFECHEGALSWSNPGSHRDPRVFIPAHA